MSYKIMSPEVVAEIVDGELVAINLESGNYYNTEAVGAHIWSCIEQGMSVQDMVASTVKLYHVEARTAESDIRDFLDSLIKEALIHENGIVIKEDQTNEAASAPTERSAYKAPVLKRHEDMQELLLLDPIHDVSEKGWPNRPQ